MGGGEAVIWRDVLGLMVSDEQPYSWSYDPCSMFLILYLMSHILCLMSFFLTSSVFLLSFVVSSVLHLMSYVFCLMNLCVTSYVFCIMSFILCPAGFMLPVEGEGKEGPQGQNR